MADQTANAGSGVPPAVAYRTLTVLFLVYVISYFDRQILSILMEPIRREIDLSDTQLGFLSGIGFFLIYALCGLPLARLADRYSRKKLITICLVVWSGMTALCGAAHNFTHLLLARMGVAVGEGGGGPASHSMIADLFPHGKRSGALAFYSCGVPLGVLLGLAVGGWINEHFSWRAAFLAAGIPGLLLAGVLWFWVPEPKRTLAVADSPLTLQSLVPLAEIRLLWQIKSFRRMAIAASLQALSAYSLTQWNPTYFIRTFGIGTAEVGLNLGLIAGTTGVIGTLAGGIIADRLGRTSPKWYALLPALAILVTMPFYFWVYQRESYTIALICLLVPSIITNLYLGPSFGTIQSLAPVRMRATAAAFLLFLLALGQAVGPQTVGLLSDLFKSLAGADSLRWSMLVLVIFKLAVVACFLSAAPGLEQDLANARDAEAKDLTDGAH